MLSVPETEASFGYFDFYSGDLHRSELSRASLDALKQISDKPGLSPNPCWPSFGNRAASPRSSTERPPQFGRRQLK
jgi:hypothetical protein